MGPYIDGQTGEWVIPLKNQFQIRSGWIDKDDPDKFPAGDYLKVLDATGKQVFYEESADILGDPIVGRRKIWEFLQACSTRPSVPTL